jgi:glycosyltransferase involved in cell wall biosynthesis
LQRAPESPPRVLAVAPGEPFDPGTWSGSSAYLLRALDRAGALAGAVDASSRALDLLEQAASFSPDRARWRLRYHSRSSPLSPGARRLRSALGSRRLRGLHAEADGVLQIGAWYDLGATNGLRCSYHDGNLAVSLARPEPSLDRSDRGIQRALAAERRLYDGLDLIFTMSDWLRRSFVDDFGQAPEKVITVGAGANLASLPQAPERSFESPRILFVGKRWERKGGPQLLEAFRLVREEQPDAELWIAGPEKPPAEAPGVRFIGRVDRGSPAGERRLDELYRGATVFAMPSVYEPFGVVFLEAMAYRLPCIGSDRCAMPEIIDDGVTGHVVGAFDTAGLVRRLLELAEPDRARSFGEAGHRRFLERYTWDGVAARMLDAVAERLR